MANKVDFAFESRIPLHEEIVYLASLFVNNFGY